MVMVVWCQIGRGNGDGVVVAELTPSTYSIYALVSIVKCEDKKREDEEKTLTKCLFSSAPFFHPPCRVSNRDIDYNPWHI